MEAGWRKQIRVSVLLLTATLPALAAGSGPDQHTEKQAEIEALGNQIGSEPEDFQRFVDGSRKLKSGPQYPSVSASAEGDRGLPLPLGVGHSSEVSAISVPASWTKVQAKDEGSDGPSLLGPALGAAVGLPLLLAGGWLLIRSPKQDPSLAEASALIAAPIPQDTSRPVGVRTRWTEPPPSAVDASPALDLAVGVPQASWRAISLREQQLIEEWDRSPEKAAGRASFEEWLDAKGEVVGVDSANLKGKLSREV